MHLHRHGDGTPKRGIRHQMQSENWSGYAVATHNTGVSAYTSATATWAVPTVAYASDGGNQTEYSSTWVGIGGVCTDTACDGSDSTLIQLGTEQDAYSDGSTDYYPWYELLPSAGAVIPHRVNPADVITTTLSCTANCTSGTQSWLLTMTDSTAGWTWSKTISYASSKLSADWIQEAPATESGTILPLANFSTVTFDAVSANGANPELSLSVDGLQMINTTGSGQTANPSAPQNGDAFTVCWGSGSTLTPCTYAGGTSTLAASILPSSRSVAVSTMATAFATIINGGTTNGVDCSIAPTTSIPANFFYQTTNPATNVSTGTADTPVTIPAGGSQSFIFGLTPTAAFSPTEVAFSFSCANIAAVTTILDVNTLLLSAATTQPADVIALVATPSADGILDITGTSGSSAFAIATANVGAAGTITATANLGSSGVPVSLKLCQTNPSTGACISSLGSSVTTTIAAGATPTFSIFATARGSVPFNPASNRIFVEFTDASGVVRGMTSVAVRTE